MAIGHRALRQHPERLLSAAPLADGNGVEFVDHIERRQFSVRTPGPVDHREASIDAFEFPVSRAVTIETDAFTIPHQFGVVVRNSLGFMVAEVTKGERDTFPPDAYSLDPGAPIKTYLRFDAGFAVDISERGIHVELDTPGPVDIGIRSHHKRPAATITTTKEVEDLMEAVSYFGSALKTTSCERSYPTLRGHPPTIELGTEQAIPSVLERPATGVHIEVPKTYRAVFSTATLAYYLGASVRPGERPRIVTDDGFVHPLGGNGRSLERDAERVLKQVFFLDCLTRTEGLFQVDLHERNQLEETLGLDFPALYDRSIAEQLPVYLGVDYGDIDPYVPRWKLTAYTSTEPAYIGTLPFLVNDLAVVRSAQSGIRGTGRGGPGRRTDDEVLAEDLQRSTADSADAPEFVRVREGESIEQAWIGPGAPIGASKAMVEAFENRLNRSPAGESIEITVACNAAEMSHEGDLVNDIYGSREDLPFDLSVHHELETDALEELLTREIDFLHYIGHIDDHGFECTDGHLDAAGLEETNVDVFFLNACSSYEQGMHLIRAGSIAGVVTIEDVINSGAERIGLTLARFLNAGFPLTPALTQARNQSIMGGNYLVIGDGGIDIAQPKGFIPSIYRVNKKAESYQLIQETFSTHERALGSIASPSIEDCEEFYLTSGEFGEFQVSHEELSEIAKVDDMPIKLEGEFFWSDKYKF